MVNESRFAGCLYTRFHFFGDIYDLIKADSILRKVNADFNYKEASADLTLSAYSITEHRFMQADSFLQKAKQLGIKPYESLTSSFDVDFELGRYGEAQLALNGLAAPNDYGYFFRKSKMEHWQGALDSSIDAMLRAARLNNGSDYLKQVALANAADLYIHAGDLQRASDLYVQCIRSDGDDFHSLAGLGWIALVHDSNDSLAEKIFQFILSKNKLPDPLFKLAQVAEVRGDSTGQMKYAEAFAAAASNALYGNMYNKYLIELYTGILKNAPKAGMIARQELNNRATPQTYAWYAWSLFKNNKKDEAYSIYRQHVSGKPLEGLELYWMGKLMQGLGKGYNASEFFKAAYTNKYDLDPAIMKDIGKSLD